MSKPLLNEAERFLLSRWSDARSLEESMEAVRNKYKELFQRVVDGVTEVIPELDASKSYPTQFWGEGGIGFGKKTWPSADAYYFPGLWIDRLRIEKLVDENSNPNATVWIPAKVARKQSIDLAATRKAVLDAAKRFLSHDEMKLAEQPDGDDEVMARLPMTSKQDLLTMIADGDGQRFVECLVLQFQSLARFIPILDDIFRAKLGQPVKGE